MKKKLTILPSALNDGSIKISGYRHASNLLLCASLLLPITKIQITNIPNLKDTWVMLEILKQLGANIAWSELKSTILLTTNQIRSHSVPKHLSEELHGSIYLMPALLARQGKVIFGKSGGCQIGHHEQNYTRPEYHVTDVMQKFGAKLSQKEDYLYILGDNLMAADVDIMKFSYTKDKVTGPLTSGATKTAILMAMAVTKGTTIIRNPFMKSEVLDLLNFIEKAGYQVNYFSDRLEISYTAHQKFLKHTCVSDPSEIITYISLAIYHDIALKLEHITPRIISILRPEFKKLLEMGVKLTTQVNSILIRPSSKLQYAEVEFTPTDICTDHHPFFLLIMLKKKGGKIIEHVWHDRFNYLPELEKIGIHLHRTNNELIVQTAIPKESISTINCPDLRAAAMLILLCSSIPATTIINYDHIIRGYVNFLENLKRLGLQYQLESLTDNTAPLTTAATF